MRVVYLLPVMLMTGCQSIENWANTHMPVIGERCYHWQCITGSGQERSEMAKGEPAAETQAQPAETGQEARKPFVPAPTPSQ